MEKFIQKIGDKAGKILLRGFNSGKIGVQRRDFSKNITTRYDLLVEKFLIDEIRKKYPTHSILSEERGLIERDKEFLWLIDPLDGTSNFINHNPFFCVEIALFRKRKPYLGFISAPAISENYFSKTGRGAFLNGRKIRVSKIKNLSKSYLCFCEGGESNRKRTLKIIKKIYPQVIELRKLGSAGLEAAWVASGRAEAYFTTKISPWDIAAGVLLVEEAGGRVSDFKGKPWQIKKSDFLVSNGKIHSDLIKLVKNL